MLLWMSLVSGVWGGELPESLQEWTDWVLESHPEADCPPDASGRPRCVWPGQLTLSLDAQGGRWELEATAFREGGLHLPGGTGAWPQEVRSQAGALSVLSLSGIPHVTLSPGSHQLRGRWSWQQPPRRLLLPPELGSFSVEWEGEPLLAPELRDGQLLLPLADASEEPEGGLQLEVSRKVQDGVPMRVEGRAQLSASGKQREVDLGPILLEGSRLLSLESELGAQLSQDGHLQVQVSPGRSVLRWVELIETPAAQLQRPEPSEHWPAVETWALVPDDQLRALRIDGGIAVDPSLTTLPEDWRALDAYQVTLQPVSLETLKRGQPQPRPDALTLERELWLDFSGEGWTARDQFRGQLGTGGALVAGEGLTPGHAQIGSRDQVLTRRDGLPSVELREVDLSLSPVKIESRQEVSLRMPAVGWQRGVEGLSMTLHIPPGWKALATWGSDRSSGSELDDWHMLRIAGLAVLVLLGRLSLGNRAALALGGVLLLIQGLPSAPVFSLGACLAVLLLPESRLRRVLLGIGLLLLTLRSLDCLVLSAQQEEVSPYSLHQGGGWEDSDSFQSRTMMESPDAGEGRRAPSAAMLKSKEKKRYEKFVDPNAVVQTGPGIPSWTHQSLRLSWEGSVSPEEQLGLLLLPPHWARLLTALRVGALLLWLLYFGRRLSAARAEPSALPSSALSGGALLLLGLWTPPAQAAPTPELLEELTERLTEKADCDPYCVNTPSMELSIRPQPRGDWLELRAEVHVGARSRWPLPGPWRPQEVTVNGADAAAVLSDEDGRLWLALEPGQHAIRAGGWIPEAWSQLALQLGSPTQELTLTAEEWSLEGVSDRGRPEDLIQLRRNREEREAQRLELQPQLSLERTLELGLPWRISSVLRRVEGSQTPVALRVPLLPGESITEAGLEVEAGEVLVPLGSGQIERRWSSTLEETDQLTLLAQSGSWAEIWTLVCSPIFSCEQLAGIPPVRHLEEARWSPQWRPWPGESVTLSFERPEALEGQTRTMDRVRLKVEEEARATRYQLELSLRSSGGGRHQLTLPAQGELKQILVNSKELPPSWEEGVVDLPLRPGRQEITLVWQETGSQGWRRTLPEIGLGADGVNLSLSWALPRGQNLLLFSLPGLGASSDRLLLLLVLLSGAWLWRRFLSPTLRWGDAVALGAALFFSSLPLTLLVFLLLPPALLTQAQLLPRCSWKLGALLQLLLFGGMMLSLGGLLWILGEGLWSGVSPRLHEGELWMYHDRFSGSFPEGWVLSVPQLLGQLIYLGLSLWAFLRLPSALLAAGKAWGEGGWLHQRRPPAKREEEPASAEEA